MSASQDSSLWEFLNTTNFNSTQNLNKLSVVLLQESSTFMREYEDWLEGLPEEDDDGEAAYFHAIEQEEKEFAEYLTTI